MRGRSSPRRGRFAYGLANQCSSNLKPIPTRLLKNWRSKSRTWGGNRSLTLPPSIPDIARVSPITGNVVLLGGRVRERSIIFPYENHQPVHPPPHARSLQRVPPCREQENHCGTQECQRGKRRNGHVENGQARRENQA